jgi:hypothetical protein
MKPDANFKTRSEQQQRENRQTEEKNNSIKISPALDALGNVKK